MFVSLKSETGEEENINAYVLEGKESLSLFSNNAEQEITIAYAVPKIVENTMSNSVYDNSYSLKGYMTITYSTNIVNGNTRYLSVPFSILVNTYIVTTSEKEKWANIFHQDISLIFWYSIRFLLFYNIVK